jgi:DNA-binding transcriptional ArsR family regulator
VQREDAVFRPLADPRQHLTPLHSAGLVSERREGRLVYYQVEPKGLRPLIDCIARYQAFWLERLDRLRALLTKMDE